MNPKCHICNKYASSMCKKCEKFACDDHFYEEIEFSYMRYSATGNGMMKQTRDFSWICAACLAPEKKRFDNEKRKNKIYCGVCKKLIYSAVPVKGHENIKPLRVGEHVPVQGGYQFVVKHVVCSEKCADMTGYEIKNTDKSTNQIGVIFFWFFWFLLFCGLPLWILRAIF